MQTVTSRTAREKFSELLNATSHGEAIRITRRGKEVARIVPPPAADTPLPDLTEFRESIAEKISGASLSQAVLDDRDEERF
jgi:prevent-host-death family protein